MEIDLRIFGDPEELAEALARAVASILASGGSAALAGGDSPLRTYRTLASRDDLPWQDITIVPTDERCLPLGDPGRNGSMLEACFSGRPCRIISFPVLPDDEEGLKSTERNISALLPFEVAVMGLGEDGHTASIFSPLPEPSSENLIMPVLDAPKAPSSRITLTPTALNTARIMFFCVMGGAKRKALGDLLRGAPIPAARLHPREILAIFADEAAAP